MKMIDLIKALYREPSLEEVISKELNKAQLEKLEAESAVEYAQSVVDYNNARITRLAQYESKMQKG